jgi:hypothetical protein
VQSDTWDKNLIKLKSAYKIVFELTQSMGLVLEHSKLEGFHFSRKHSDSNPDIDLGYAPYTGATPLHPGTTWQYLCFTVYLMVAQGGSWRNRMSNRDFIRSNRLIVQLCLRPTHNMNSQTFKAQMAVGSWAKTPLYPGFSEVTKIIETAMGEETSLEVESV